MIELYSLIYFCVNPEDPVEPKEEVDEFKPSNY